MTRGWKIGLLVFALAAAAIAFALARPGGEEREQAAPQPPPPEETRSAATEAPPGEPTQPETTEEAGTLPAETTVGVTNAGAPPKPRPLVVRTRGGKPVNGITEITVRKGETLRFVVTSDIPEEVHVHGYDIIKDVGPGAPARFRFRAEFEGIFEVELEGAGVQIIELRVEP